MQKMSQEEMSNMLEDNLRNKVQAFLDSYQGPGKRVLDREGHVREVVMTDHQKRTHDRSYRARLIREGVLTPKRKRV